MIDPLAIKTIIVRWQDGNTRQALPINISGPLIAKIIVFVELIDHPLLILKMRICCLPNRRL
jgi:hypothetical protein|tara:strand:+ start:1837 stop:2022 length:186 start_codon:yes stop_codon:yes gene_type:complete